MSGVAVTVETRRELSTRFPAMFVSCPACADHAARGSSGCPICADSLVATVATARQWFADRGLPVPPAALVGERVSCSLCGADHVADRCPQIALVPTAGMAPCTLCGLVDFLDDDGVCAPCAQTESGGDQCRP